MVILIFILFVKFVCGQNLTQIYPDYKNHSCNRECDGSTKICEYTLTIDTFYTMQQECLNCTTGNDVDCENPQCIPANGLRRSVQVVNGILPGPAIIVCQGDTIKATLVNNLFSESTSIHWHGIHQQKSPFMDGVPMVTQCPITPHTNFTYNFIATEVGTNFYHSHSGLQRGNGIYGPLIVHENVKASKKTKQYDFDLSDHIMCVMEWLIGSPDDAFFYFQRNKITPYSFIDSLMINGYAPTINNTVPPKKFYVEKGYRYRFRVIHTGVLVRPIEISIDGHQLTVISSDGSDIEPVTVDRLTITNGERFDFILKADQRVGQYAIRLNSSILVDISGLGLLVYKGASEKGFKLPKKTRKGTNVNCVNTRNVRNCYQYGNLTSVTSNNASIKRNPDLKLYFVVNFSNYSVPRYAGLNESELTTPLINNIQYTPASSPLLTNPEASTKNWCDYRNPKNCRKNKFCSCLHLVEVGNNKLVEIVLIDNDFEFRLAHPIHLHGYKFYVLGQEEIGDSISIDRIKTLDKDNKLMRNFNKPIIKDTVVIPNRGYTIIRFFADNPGYWLLHCHVDIHSEDGMQLVMLVGNKRQRIAETPKNFPTCGNFKA